MVQKERFISFLTVLHFSPYFFLFITITELISVALHGLKEENLQFLLLMNSTGILVLLWFIKSYMALLKKSKLYSEAEKEAAKKLSETEEHSCFTMPSTTNGNNDLNTTLNKDDPDDIESPIRWKEAYKTLCRFNREILINLGDQADYKCQFKKLHTIEELFVRSLRSFHPENGSNKLLVQAERIAWAYWPKSLKNDKGEHGSKELALTWASNFSTVQFKYPDQERDKRGKIIE